MNRKAQVIAFYLPQFHPFQKMTNGGEMVLQNGQMLVKLSLYLKDIGNREFLLIWAIMI